MNKPGLFTRFIQSFPVPLTQEEGQIRLVKKLIAQVCKPNSSCIDIGAYKGFYLNLMIHAAPQVEHIAFEPIPKNYNQLVRKYSSAARVYKTALSDEKGPAVFYHTLENSSYSGLKKLAYPIKMHLEKLDAETDLLDNVANDIVPHLIKLTVQGAELRVLKGATRLIQQHKPLILFLPDSGDLDMFQCSPEAVFDYFIKTFAYKIFTVKSFLAGARPLTRLEFARLLDGEKKWWYIATPAIARTQPNAKPS